MFPNPQDALPLPQRPNLEQYKRLAKDLVKVCKPDDPQAVRAWAVRWVESLAKLSSLAIAPEMPVRADRWVDQVEEFARRKMSADGGLADAQFVIARSHGFESWPRFAKHLEGLARASQVSSFEAAADAIVAGDLAALERLLKKDAGLVRARSSREHRATLLHYVSANGVEGYRQRTPRNIVEIAKLLLNAGAEVDAEADVYGGGATTLGLAATSVHPERAGVQEELMGLLLQRGAKMDRDNSAGNGQSIVTACLANGRGKAAEFLARRVAQLDIEGAAGVGRLEVVKAFFNHDGSLKPSAIKAQMERGFLWACEYGHMEVIKFLLRQGVDIHTQANTGQTGLHWAVIGDQLETVKLLLAHGASLEEKNAYDGTVLGQALWSSVHGDADVDYVPIIEVLIAAGAKVEEGSLEWLAAQKGGEAGSKQRIAVVLRRHGAKT
jgi:ankyrin repeat protein